nr:hypothetical protein [Ancylobacter gelatini]
MRPAVVRSFRPGDLATSHLGALTVPFALFLAFMVGDIWQRGNQFAETLLHEVQRIEAMRDLLWLCGAECVPVTDALRSYARALAQHEWQAGWTEPHLAVSTLFDTLSARLAALKDSAVISDQLRNALVVGQGELRRLRTDRYFILHAELAPYRWTVVFVLGVLSQVGIAALHVGRRPQLIVGLATFSLAFAVTLSYTVSLAWPTVDTGIIPAQELRRILD